LFKICFYWNVRYIDSLLVENFAWGLTCSVSLLHHYSLATSFMTHSNTGSHKRLDLIQSFVPAHCVCNGYIFIQSNQSIKADALYNYAIKLFYNKTDLHKSFSVLTFVLIVNSFPAFAAKSWLNLPLITLISVPENSP
jgi:hypothetical protein